MDHSLNLFDLILSSLLYQSVLKLLCRLGVDERFRCGLKCFTSVFLLNRIGYLNHLAHIFLEFVTAFASNHFTRLISRRCGSFKNVTTFDLFDKLVSMGALRESLQVFVSLDALGDCSFNIALFGLFNKTYHVIHLFQFVPVSSRRGSLAKKALQISWIWVLARDHARHKILYILLVLSLVHSLLRCVSDHLEGRGVERALKSLHIDSASLKLAQNSIQIDRAPERRCLLLGVRRPLFHLLGLLLRLLYPLSCLVGLCFSPVCEATEAELGFRLGI